ncbi:MAG: 2-hydroxyacyl-CoA dehydratase subunit D [Candidatus Hodarchaeota archaeon]
MQSMLKTYFDDLEQSLRKKLENKVTPRRKFIHEIARIGCKMFDPQWATAWTTVFVPFEILEAMGISGMFIEFIGAMLAGANMSKPYFESAEQLGYSTDGCSYHRTIIGAAEKQLFPEPDLLIGSSCPCFGGVKAIQRLGDFYNKKFFVLNPPINDTPSDVDYFVNQYEKMIEHIENATGRTLSDNKLKRAMKCNNESRKYLLEAYEYCKQVPSPSNSNDFKNFIIFALLSGIPEGVEVAKVYRDDLARRVENGIQGVPGEKHRLLWVQNRIQFKNDLIEILEQQYKANVVIDELNYIYWEEMDELDPLRSIAIRQIKNPILGPVDRRMKYIVKMAKEFKIDGAINPAHWGCRQSSGAKAMFKDTLQKIGIPLIHLDVDCVDERNFSKGQILTRLEAFMELLA